MSNNDVPEWAKARVIELMDAEYGKGNWLQSANASAFARYIAQHEEPPVDPLIDLLQKAQRAALGTPPSRIAAAPQTAAALTEANFWPEFAAALRARLPAAALAAIDEGEE